MLNFITNYFNNAEKEKLVNLEEKYQDIFNNGSSQSIGNALGEILIPFYDKTTGYKLCILERFIFDFIQENATGMFLRNKYQDNNRKLKTLNELLKVYLAYGVEFENILFQKKNYNATLYSSIQFEIKAGTELLKEEVETKIKVKAENLFGLLSMIPSIGYNNSKTMANKLNKILVKVKERGSYNYVDVYGESFKEIIDNENTKKAFNEVFLKVFNPDKVGNDLTFINDFLNFGLYEASLFLLEASSPTTKICGLNKLEYINVVKELDLFSEKDKINMLIQKLSLEKALPEVDKARKMTI